MKPSDKTNLEVPNFDQLQEMFGEALTKYKVIIRKPHSIDPAARITTSLFNAGPQIIESFDNLDDAIKYRNTFIRARNTIQIEGKTKEPYRIEIRSYHMNGKVNILQSDGTWIPAGN